MSWAIHHAQSEELACQAEAALRKGERDGARELYRLSAKAEERALDALDPSKTRTLGITAVSAASLWFKANEWKQVERVACHWIAADLLPDFAIAQLQEVLQTTWHERDFRQSGTAFVRGQVTISLAGGEVGSGAAPLALVHRKANEICHFFYRIIEMTLNRPFRKRGSPSTDILEHCRPWLLQAPPGSYQFAMRFQRPVQLSLFQEMLPKIEEITQQFMHIVRTATQETREDLEQIIPDPAYRSGFVKMSRDLAPTGKTFSKLEITANTDTDASPIVLLPESREVLNNILRYERENRDITIQEESIFGILHALHLDNDWLEITSNEGLPIRIYQTGDVIDDIVGPMVNQRVIVTVNQRNGRYLFTTGHFIETILKWTFKRLSLIVYSMLREKPEEKEHAMSDNLHRYRAIREALIQGYPGELHGRSVRHLTTLAALISGIVGGKSTQLPHIATKVPDGTKPESRVKRFTRWLDNDRILEEVYFLPYAALFLTH